MRPNRPELESTLHHPMNIDNQLPRIVALALLVGMILLLAAG